MTNQDALTTNKWGFFFLLFYCNDIKEAVNKGTSPVGSEVICGIYGQGSRVAVASPHHAKRRVLSQGCGGQYRGIKEERDRTKGKAKEGSVVRVMEYKVAEDQMVRSDLNNLALVANYGEGTAKKQYPCFIFSDTV